MKQQQGINHAPVAPTSTKILSTSTVSKMKQDSQNNPLASFNDDNKIDLLEDLETKCLCEYEQGGYSPTLVNKNDRDPEIQKRCVDEADDWEKLKQ